MGFYRAAPSYRGHQPQAQSSTGVLSGFWCGLFGGTPAYKQAGRNESTIAPRCWWQAFPATPQYKTVPADNPEDCVPETPPPECPDDEPEVYLADDGTSVW
jgi:hypothetical protein